MATKKTVRETMASAPRMSAQDKKWQTESDLRVLQSAAEVTADPQRMAAAQKHAQKQIAMLASVAKKK